MIFRTSLSILRNLTFTVYSSSLCCWERWRRIASARVDEERVNASVVREAADESVQAHRRLQLLVGKLAASKTISDNIALQLRLLNEHKDHYVSKHGEESWVEKVNDLLSKLPDPSGE